LITYFDADYDVYNEYRSIIFVSLLSYFSIFFPAFSPYLVCTKNRKHENTLVEYIIKDLIVTVR